MNRALCCFVDPKFSDEPRSLDDSCPDCGRTYGFPLTHAPEVIGDFKVVQALDRGFYSAVYQVTYGALDADYVLKVAPKTIYETFKDYGKDFEHECRIHRDVAAGSDHLVGIHNMFDLDVTFGDITMPCHVAQLDYLDGLPLKDILGAEPPPLSRTVAQIVLDLLQLLEELQAKESFHNDLHGSNIIVQTLPASSRRAEALDGSIRVVAVDLGSVTDGSKSDISRLGDLHSIGRYIEVFASRLMQRPGETADVDYRLAGSFRKSRRCSRPRQSTSDLPSSMCCATGFAIPMGSLRPRGKIPHRCVASTTLQRTNAASVVRLQVARRSRRGLVEGDQRPRSTGHFRDAWMRQDDAAPFLDVSCPCCCLPRRR